MAIMRRGKKSKVIRRKKTFSDLFTPDDIIEIMRIADSMLDKIIRGVISKEIRKRTGIESKKLGTMDLRTSAYRFLRLSPGCGKLAVKSAYRRAIKDLRPDIEAKTREETDFKQTKNIALKNARDILLNIETKE